MIRSSAVYLQVPLACDSGQFFQFGDRIWCAHFCNLREAEHARFGMVGASAFLHQRPDFSGSKKFHNSFLGNKHGVRSPDSVCILTTIGFRYTGGLRAHKTD
jgi:hypothetical protein